MPLDRGIFFGPLTGWFIWLARTVSKQILTIKKQSYQCPLAWNEFTFRNKKGDCEFLFKR